MDEEETLRSGKKDSVKVELFHTNAFFFLQYYVLCSSWQCCFFSSVNLKGEQFVFYEDWGEALVQKSSPVLCVVDIEGNNVSVLEGVPENISPGQVGAHCPCFLSFATPE